MIKLSIVLLTGVLSACGSPDLRPPEILEQVHAADKAARKALRRGDRLRAQHNFAKALVLQQSLDNTQDAATTLINLATVHHQQHDDKTALMWLDKILQEKTQIYSLASQITAAFRKAVILSDLGRLDDADTVLQSAEKLCANRCRQRFSLDALHARLLLLKGHAKEALIVAQALTEENTIAHEELANVLRTVAAAEEQLARYPDALQHYRAALETDKALALSLRIGDDLAGIARVLIQLGRPQEAAIYARRATLVAESVAKDAHK